MFDSLKSTLEKKMQDSQKVFETNMKGLRTGRASPQLLESIEVDAYGSKMPLNHMANVTVQGPLALSVQVFDAQMTPLVEKSIRESGLGLNPQAAGTTLRIILPDLTEERRKELAKKLTAYAEEARVAIRSVRRQGMDALKKAEKDKEVSEDELRAHEKILQQLTDKAIEKINTLLGTKEKELMKV